ncbi:MAG: TonB-dependent receptor [Bacteroidales bacterium]|nr:TonB-dependent receptor [Bacteroidales bacterium]
MKKMMIAACCLAVALPCFAQPREQRKPERDTIRTSVIAADKGAGMRSLMTQEALVRSADLPEGQAQTVEQLLRLSPAVDIRERGGKSVQTDICLRGGSFDQTMVQLNGIDFTDARTGHQSHSLPVDADLLSGIDLVEGIGGNTGLTGAVNLRTVRSDERYLRANLTGGMYGYAYGNLSGSTRVAGERLTLFGAGSYRRSDGYKAGTDFSNGNIYARATYIMPRSGTIDAQAGWQKRDFGAAGFYSLAFPDQYEKTSTALGSVRWMKASGRFTFDNWVAYRKNFDCFQLIRGDESYVPYNHHQTDNYGVHAAAGYRWAAGTTTIVGNYAANVILSTVLGEDIRPGQVREGRLQVSGYDRRYTKYQARHTGDAFLRHEWSGDHIALQLSAGAAFSPYGTAPLWNAHADWRPDGHWHLDAGIAQTMRLPTFTDLYYNAPGHKGNPDLQPEKALTVKAGATYAAGPFGLGVTGFYRHGSNVIDWVRQDAQSEWRSMQITELDTYGADLKAEYRGRDWLYRATLLYGYILTGKESAGMISAYALDYLRNKLAAAVDLRPWNGRLSLLLTGTVYDRIGNYAAADGSTQSYRPYFLLNANLGFETGWIRNGSLRFYVEGENLTGTRYFDFGGLEMPGVWLNCGVVVRL